MGSCGTYSTPEGFEYRLYFVVLVLAADVIDVERAARVIGEALKKLTRQIDIETSDVRTDEITMIKEPWPARKVDDYARQCLVERHVGVPVANNSGAICQCLIKRLTETDADILYRVMIVYFGIAVAVNAEIDQPVTNNLVQHVVEERHATVQISTTRTIDIEIDTNSRFERVSHHAGRATGHVSAVYE